MDATIQEPPKKGDIDPETVISIFQIFLQGKPYTKSKLKKLVKRHAQLKKKQALKLKREAEAKKKELERLEESKAIVVEEDPSLPKAIRCRTTEVSKHVEKRVKLMGWIHFLRTNGGLVFLEIRDGFGFENLVQCVLAGKLAKCYDALVLHRETTVQICGVVKKDERAKGGYEINADYWKVIGKCPSSVENILQSKDPIQIYDKRHILIRQQRVRQILMLRDRITRAFRQWFFENDFNEVVPPTIVKCEVEGGSSLFKVDYYGSDAYLTQSSQLYLETACPALGNVFCCLSSYRAEKSRTRRHLSEYMHIEGEMAFIDFEDLLGYLEDMICGVCEIIDKKFGDEVRKMNPKWKPVKKPIKRMRYSEAIKYLKENDIPKEICPETKEKIYYEDGEDIPESPERKMIDKIGEPVFLTHFPAHLKSFYMTRCGKDNKLTESVDFLMPGVGEIIGGSMRMSDYDELMKAFEDKKIGTENYYWYTDLRKYGFFFVPAREILVAWFPE